MSRTRNHNTNFIDRYYALFSKIHAEYTGYDVYEDEDRNEVCVTTTDIDPEAPSYPWPDTQPVGRVAQLKYVRSVNRRPYTKNDVGYVSATYAFFSAEHSLDQGHGVFIDKDNKEVFVTRASNDPVAKTYPWKDKKRVGKCKDLTLIRYDKRPNADGVSCPIEEGSCCCPWSVRRADQHASFYLGAGPM